MGLLNLRTMLSKNFRVSRTRRQDRSVDYGPEQVPKARQYAIQDRPTIPRTKYNQLLLQTQHSTNTTASDFVVLVLCLNFGGGEAAAKGENKNLLIRPSKTQVFDSTKHFAGTIDVHGSLKPTDWIAMRHDSEALSVAVSF